MTNLFDEAPNAVGQSNLFDQPTAPNIFDKPVEPAKGYTQSNLTEDQYYPVVSAYLKDRYGYDDTFLNNNKEDAVNIFLNNRRGVSGGNTYRSVSEIAYLNSIKDDPEKFKRTGDAYKLFENMSGAFSSDASWADTGEAILDYTRSAILDPANILGGFAGKALVGGVSRGASATAQRLAMKAYQAELTSQLASGATKEAAKKLATAAGAKLFEEKFAAAATTQTAKMVTDRAALQAAKNTFEKVTTSKAVKEALAVSTIDGLVSVGTEVAYQDGLIRTGVQDEFDKFSIGLAALGGLVAGGLNVAGTALKGSSKLAYIAADVADANPAGVQPKLNQSVKDLFTKGNWKEKVGRGKELSDLDSTFFTTLMLGDKELGIKGLNSILLEEGYVWHKRGPDDKYTNWVTDIIKTLDPQDSEKFLKEFEVASGVKLPELGDAVKNLNYFTDVMAKKFSDSARVLGSAGLASRNTGKKVEETTIDDYLSTLFDFGMAEDPSRVGKGLNKLSNLPVGKAITNFQDRVVRGIVSNLSTARLNTVGWVYSTGLNSVTDLSLGLLHGGSAGLQVLLGKNQAAGESFRVARQLYTANLQRVRNLLDPETTYEAFNSVLIKRGKFLQDLDSTGFAGVRKGMENSGFDPTKTWLGQKTDDALEALNIANFGKASESLVTSQEFMYQLDKNLRLAFNKSFSEFHLLPDAAKQMASEKYLRAEAKALYETKRAIFSQSFKGKDALGEMAAVIEDFRKVPAVGILIPFGRFFNNTLAVMADGSGLSVVGKMMGYSKQRSTKELMVRAAVTWAGVGYLVNNEREGRDDGLGLFEGRDSVTGMVIDYKYDFPYSFYKGTARMLSYMQDGKDIPPGMVDQYLEVMGGQIFRQLNDTQKGLWEMFKAALTGDANVLEVITAATGAVGSQAVSGLTRGIDPLNELTGLMRGVDYTSIDRRQGSKVLNTGLRYMDQIIAAATGKDLAPQKYTAATGRSVSTATKYLGGRESTALTPFRKVLNIVGIQDYTQSSYTEAEAADNRYNLLFNKLADEGAQRLLDSEKFKSLPLEDQTFFVQKLTTDTAAQVKAVMKSNILESGDRRLALMLKIGEANSELKISKALKEISSQTGEKDLVFDDLTEDQLDVLDNYFKYKKTFIMEK